MSLRIVCGMLAVALGTEAQAQEIPLESVVKIENAAIAYNYTAPWNAPQYEGGTGTGFYIGDNQFLTNAHVVSSSRRLMMTLPNDPTPHPATLLFIAHDCDLALLKLDDEALTEGLKPLRIGSTPKLDSEVRAVGFPIGGQRLSVTRGVVSRIDYVGYSHSQVDQHLAVQIDAAINPGNSGGPVMQGGKVVGVAFQGLVDAESAGYMIPPPVIERFLEDIGDGRYDGYVELGLSPLPLVNPAQRRALGLANDGVGVLVNELMATSSVDGYLRVNDILLAIDRHPIASNGTVQIDGEQLNMAEVVERLFVGDKVGFELIREGKKMEVTLPLKTLPPLKILATEYDEAPRYVVAAGLVFQPVNRNLMSAVNLSSQARRALEEYLSEDGFLERPDIVVFTQVLPDSINSGAEEFIGGVVESVDGQPVRTLQDVHRLLNERFDAPANAEASEFIEIRLRELGRPVLLNRAQAREAHQRVLAAYGLRNDSRLGAERNFKRESPRGSEAAGAVETVEDVTAAPEQSEPVDGPVTAEPAGSSASSESSASAESSESAANPLQGNPEAAPTLPRELAMPASSSPTAPTPDPEPKPEPAPLPEPAQSPEPVPETEPAPASPVPETPAAPEFVPEPIDSPSPEVSPGAEPEEIPTPESPQESPPL